MAVLPPIPPFGKLMMSVSKLVFRTFEIGSFVCMIFTRYVLAAPMLLKWRYGLGVPDVWRSDGFW